VKTHQKVKRDEINILRFENIPWEKFSPVLERRSKGRFLKNSRQKINLYELRLPFHHRKNNKNHIFSLY
jgi:hypothetical protein